MFYIIRRTTQLENGQVVSDREEKVYSSKTRERIDWIWDNHTDVLQTQRLPECESGVRCCGVIIKYSKSYNTLLAGIYR